MKPQDKKQLSSKQLLDKIGCNALPDLNLGLLDDEDGLDGDLTSSLRERYRQLKLIKHSFRPGMVVMWKPGLKNRKWPAYGKPLIVVSVLDTPVFDTAEESGSAYFREPMDMIIGLFVDSGEHRGDFCTFHVSSECFQPWPGEEV